MKKKDLITLGVVLALSIPFNVFAATTVGTNVSVAGGTLTVGADDTGYDVTFYGATSGKYWLWDESADQMVVAGSSVFNGTLTVGVDDTGYDVTFYGATSGAGLLWDESADSLYLNNASFLNISTSAGVNGPQFGLYHDSGSPAANDVVGSYYVLGKSSTGNIRNYGAYNVEIVDPTNGAEYGASSIKLAQAGSSTEVARIYIDADNNSGVIIGGGTSSNPNFLLQAEQTNGNIGFVPNGTGIVDSTTLINVASEVSVTAGGAAAVTMGDGDMGIYYGSGVPTVSAPQGSLYLRTDGSSTTTRMYINTDGGTTWTNVTTAS